MAGFPFYQLDRFLKILVEDMNKYVAISEEFPNAPETARATGLMHSRRVTRVVTPGTLINENFLDPLRNNFLLSIYIDPSLSTIKEPELRSDERQNFHWPVGLAWIDLSTGDFYTRSTTADLLSSSISSISPQEIILDESFSQASIPLQKILGQDDRLLTFYNAKEPFADMSEWDDLLDSSSRNSTPPDLTIDEKLACHSLLDYVRTRIQGLEMRLQPPQRRSIQDQLFIDRSTLKALEILETAREGLGKGSLLNSIRRTVTKSGARLLRSRLTAPSISLPEIDRRLDLVESFLADEFLRDRIVSLLKNTYDIQRLVQKFSLNQGQADDLLCLSRAVTASQRISEILKGNYNRPRQSQQSELQQSPEENRSEGIQTLLNRFDFEEPAALTNRITTVIDEEGLSKKQEIEEIEAAEVANLAQETIDTEGSRETAPAISKKARNKAAKTTPKEADAEFDDTWVMRRSASDELTRLHGCLDKLKDAKVDLTQSLRHRLNTAGISLKFTSGLGYICHVRGNNNFALDEARLVSSTKSTRSFYLSEWTNLGKKIDQIKSCIRFEEQQIFIDLRNEVVRNLVKLRRISMVLDELDVACSFAVLAREQSLVRPRLNTGTFLKIIGGRHPTVEIGLEEQGRLFVQNDLFLGGQERIWLVTGPNMAGKSTFLRQNALISIMAQTGSFVPAEYAEIGLVDKVFSRVGAADDLYREQSTFMVEMLETAAILKNATSRSLVVMDEVGRGTTPEDGTAIGYACLYHLYHVNRCRALFATHFHALADMTEQLPEIGRYCTDILEQGGGSFTFSRRLRKGVNRQSHALKIARLAGLPEAALSVATSVLSKWSCENMQVVPDSTTDNPISTPPRDAAVG
ncbi:MAG: hypothetical protein Q9160_007952 [Pyrenula sp. 1 TL-2023]